MATTVHSSADARVNSTLFYDETAPFRTAGVVIGIFDIIVGSIGNLLTILAIYKNKKLHKPFHFFIANLSVIDFLTATAMMPFNVTAYYTQTWPFGEDDFSCTLMAYFYYCCGYTSIVCLIVITVNRFIGVVYPEDYVRLFTKQRIFIAIVISWLFAPAFLFPVFFFNGGGYGWNHNQTLCVFRIFEFDEPQKNYMQFNRVLFQFLPLVVMIVLYTKIFLTSKQSGRIVTQLTVQSYSGVNVSRSSSRSAKPSPLLGRKIMDEQSLTTNFLDTSSVHSSANELNHAGMSLLQVQKNNVNETLSVATACPRPCTSNSLQNYLESRFSNDQYFTKELSGTQSDLQLRNTVDEVGNEKKVLNKISNQPSPRFFPSLKLYLSKSASVPTTPMLSERKQFNIQPRLQSLHNPLHGSRHSNLHSKPCSTPVSRSRCSSRGSKYASAIKLEEKKRKKVDRRLLRISMTICTTFTILFLPSVIVNLMPSVKNPKYHMFASFITWLNSCVNPLIYSFMNANMRLQYRLLLIKFWNAICRCFKIDENSFQKNMNRSVRSTSSSRLSRKGLSP